MIFNSDNRLLPHFLLIIVFIFGFFTVGCGYSFRADGEPVGITLESLAIPQMTSTSSSLGFEADFTKIIREEFISHAKIPLESVERAQAVLSGRVYDIRTEPIAFDRQVQTISGHTTIFSVTSRRRLIVKLDAKLTEKASGKVIWQEQAMEDKASFDVGTDPLANRFNQQQALKEIARSLAKRIYLKTVERF